MASYLDVRQPKQFEVARVDVGGEHAALRAHAIRQPTGHRTTPTADLEALPAPCYAPREELADVPD